MDGWSRKGDLGRNLASVMRPRFRIPFCLFSKMPGLWLGYFLSCSGVCFVSWDVLGNVALEREECIASSTYFIAAVFILADIRTIRSSTQ